MLRPFHLRQGIDSRPQEPSRSYRHRQRRFRTQIMQHALGTGNRDQTANRHLVQPGRRHNMTLAKTKAFLQRRAQIHAVRDRVRNTDADDLLLRSQRHQALRGLPRHPQNIRDLVLCLAGHVIQPGRAGRLIQLAIMFAHRLSRPRTRSFDRILPRSRAGIQFISKIVIKRPVNGQIFK